jgi:hypothetical protein
MFPARDVPPESSYPRERRSSRRYPVGLDLRFALSRRGAVLERGSGRTRDFSEGGVFFQPFRLSGILPPGVDAELFLDWPARLNGEAVVTVTISGRIVRSSADGIAVQISRCDVRANRGRSAN